MTQIYHTFRKKLQQLFSINQFVSFRKSLLDPKFHEASLYQLFIAMTSNCN